MNMIADRTLSDVTKAIKLVQEKVQKFADLTPDDIVSLERGCLTINTLNRIENMQNNIKGTINNMGYWNTPIINKIWSESDLFSNEEWERIIDNNLTIINAFYVYPNTPKVVNRRSYHYETLNAIEKILIDIYEMVKDVKSYYKECGEIECGEV